MGTAFHDKMSLKCIFYDKYYLKCYFKDILNGFQMYFFLLKTATTLWVRFATSLTTNLLNIDLTLILIYLKILTGRFTFVSAFHIHTSISDISVKPFRVFKSILKAAVLWFRTWIARYAPLEWGGNIGSSTSYRQSVSPTRTPFVR